MENLSYEGTLQPYEDLLLNDYTKLHNSVLALVTRLQQPYRELLVIPI